MHRREEECVQQALRALVSGRQYVDYVASM
jgi:hypothetical protein